MQIFSPHWGFASILLTVSLKEQKFLILINSTLHFIACMNDVFGILSRKSLHYLRAQSYPSIFPPMVLDWSYMILDIGFMVLVAGL